MITLWPLYCVTHVSFTDAAPQDMFGKSDPYLEFAKQKWSIVGLLYQIYGMEQVWSKNNLLRLLERMHVCIRK